MRVIGRFLHKSVVGVAAGALGAFAVSAMGVAGATSAAAATGSTRLAFDVFHGLSVATDDGPAPAGTVLQIGLGLSLPDRSAAAAYYAEEYDPASPNYHVFLTPAQFAARFGVPQATYQQVASWLESGGLHVDGTAPAGDWIAATGSVSQLESLFKTPINSYSYDGLHFLANTEAPAVPTGDSIMTVVGLNTLQQFSIPKEKGGATPSGTPGCLPTNCYYSPQDMWSMYDLPANNEGQGQTLGIFGEGQTADVISNLRLFEKNFKLAEIPVNVDYIGQGPFTDDSGQVEWDLDTQATTGMAPEVSSVTLYFGNTLQDATVESLFNAWANDPNGPKQMNASFGECETDPGNPAFGNPTIDAEAGPGDDLEPVAEQTLMQAVMEGRTLFSSAGDTGSSCPIVAAPVIGAGNGVLNQGFADTNYPCSSNYAVCVGGTQLYSDGNTPPSRAEEISWPYTGGGAALFQQEPAFQKGDSAVDVPCAVDHTGTPYPPGTVCRGVPDVAAMSGDVTDNGYDIYANGAATTEGGTSLSSPLWVGMWTRIQAAAPIRMVHGHKTYPGLGFADPLLYKVGETAAYSKDFFDVTVGDNGAYHAATGWDYVSGWGVPVLTNLMQTLDNRTAPVNPVLPKPPVNNNKCNALWLDGPHTANDIYGNSDPQLTLYEGNMSLTPAGNVLRVRITVQNLTETVPTGATGADWYMTWTYNGTIYFAQAQLAATPTSVPTYEYGTVTKTGNTSNYGPLGSVTGSFTTGPDGVVEVDVPLSDVGNPANGAVLSGPTGITFIEIGVPSNPSGESVASLQQVDTGGPTNNYTVGSVTGTKGCTLPS